MRAQSVSGVQNAYGSRNRSSMVKQSHRLISEEKSPRYLSGQQQQYPVGMEKVSLSGGQQLPQPQQQQRFSVNYETQLGRKLQSPQKQSAVVNNFISIDSSGRKKTQQPSVIGQPRQWNIFTSNFEVANMGVGSSVGIGGQYSMKSSVTGSMKPYLSHQQQQSWSATKQDAVSSKMETRFSGINLLQYDQEQQQPQSQLQQQQQPSPQSQVSRKQNIGARGVAMRNNVLMFPQNYQPGLHSSALEAKYIQMTDELQQGLVKDNNYHSGNHVRMHSKIEDNLASSPKWVAHQAGLLRQARDPQYQETKQLSLSRKFSNEKTGERERHSRENRKLNLRDAMVMSSVDGDSLGMMALGDSESLGASMIPFVTSSSKQVSAVFDSQLQQQQQQQRFEKGQISSKRSLSAVKSIPKQKRDDSQQLMILKVKQQCTKKRYNDPHEIKKQKEKLKEVKDGRMNTLAAAGSLNKKGFGQEEDDDESDQGSNDVSLDLDDDDEDDAYKRTSSMAILSAQTSATLTPQSKVHLLKSIYQGRPMTVFFPYHKSCQQPKQRDMINGDNPYKCVVKAFEEAGFTPTSDGDWNSQWSLPKKDKVKKMNPFQRLNHFPGCWNLGRKDFMWRCLNRAKRRNPKEMDFVPNTYLLCNQGDWDRFLTRKEEASKNQLWICKPADQACGRGIKVISKNSRVKRKTNRIICDYIMNPHLINGLKYDLRLYVLVTSYDPLRIYLYDEGLTRFATEKYTTNTKEVTKRYVHLTNYSVNKYATKFVKNTNSENDGEGSKWSHTALRAKYADMGIDVEDLFAKISDVIIKTCISAEPNMLDIHAKASEHRTNCFELYGFDVLIDSKLKPWILEVNVCPSLSSSSPLDRKIKHSLLVDTMNIIGITPYDKKHYQEESKKNGPFHRASMTSVLIDSEDAKNGLSLTGKKNFSKNINDIQDLNADNCLEKLSPENWEILFETDEEYHRRGHFQRIFPPASPEKREYYSQFFEFQRFNNIIIDKWMSSPVNFLEKIIKKKYNTSV